MLAVYIILGIVAFLLLILLIPVYLHVSFDNILRVKVGYGFVFFTVYPRPKKAAKKEVEKQQKKKPKKKKHDFANIEQMIQEDGIIAVVSFYSELAKLLVTASKKLLKAITIDKIKLYVLVASDDAAQTAVNYGKVCAAVYPAQALLESTMRVKQRKISISTDFLRDKGAVKGEFRLHVLPLQILLIALQFFIGYIGNTMHKQPANSNDILRERG